MGIGAESNDRLALAILACLGIGAPRRPRQRDPRRDPAAEPADRDARRRPDRPRLGPPVLARRHRRAPTCRRRSRPGPRRSPRRQRGVLDGRHDHDRRRARAAVHGCRPSIPGRGRESASRLDGRRPRPDARRARVHGGRPLLRVRSRPAGRCPHQRRPGLRRRLPARADRRGRHRRGVALGRPGERDLDVDRRTRAHAADADAADPRTVDGDAVRRLRRGDHRRNARCRATESRRCSGRPSGHVHGAGPPRRSKPRVEHERRQ